MLRKVCDNSSHETKVSVLPCRKYCEMDFYHMRKLVVLFLLATTVLCSGCGGKNSVPSSEESTPFYIKNPTQIEAEREEARLKEEEALQHSIERDENNRVILEETERKQEELSEESDLLFDEFAKIVNDTLYSNYVTISLKYNAVAGCTVMKAPSFSSLYIYNKQKSVNYVSSTPDGKMVNIYLMINLLNSKMQNVPFNLKYTTPLVGATDNNSIAADVLDDYGLVTALYTADKKGDYEITKSSLGDSVTYSVKHLIDRTKNNVYGYYLIANTRNGIIETVTSADKSNYSSTPIQININTDKTDLENIDESDFTELKSKEELTTMYAFGLSYVFTDSQPSDTSIDALKEEYGLR